MAVVLNVVAYEMRRVETTKQVELTSAEGIALNLFFNYGQLVNAIKYMRCSRIDASGEHWGLKEAKDVVDAYWTWMLPKTPGAAVRNVFNYPVAQYHRYMSREDEIHNAIDWLRCPDEVKGRVIDKQYCERIIDLLQSLGRDARNNNHG